MDTNVGKDTYVQDDGQIPNEFSDACCHQR